MLVIIGNDQVAVSGPRWSRWRCCFSWSLAHFRWLKLLERCHLTDVPQRMCVKDQDCRRWMAGLRFL